jgi:hypothetical protein
MGGLVLLLVELGALVFFGRAQQKVATGQAQPN